MTALTVNGSAAAAATLAAAGKMFAATGGTSGSATTKISGVATFRQLIAIGSTTNTTNASIPAPTDSNFAGWIWDVTTLEGQRIAAGTWTPTIHLTASTAVTLTPTLQWYKRSSGGVYTQIGTVTGSTTGSFTASTLLTFTPPSLALMDFAVGDKLCMWLWVQQTAGGATNSTVGITEAISGSTLGVVSEAQSTTPGYAPIPVALSVTIPGTGILAPTLSANVALGATVAGVGTLAATLAAGGVTPLTVLAADANSTTLTTAKKLYSVVGAVNSSYSFHESQYSSTGATGYFEATTQGTSSAEGTNASLPAPSGLGFLWDVTTLEGQDIVAGNWTPAIRLTSLSSSNAPGGTQTADLIVRAYNRSSSGVYTLIVTCTLSAQSLTSTATTYTFAATAASAMSFLTGDKLYIDVWIHATANTAWGIRLNRLSTDTATLTGDPNEEVVTPGFKVSSSGVSLAITISGVGTLVGIPSLVTALTSTIAGVGILRKTSPMSPPTDGHYIYDFISPDAGSGVWGPRLDQIAAGGFKLVMNYALLAGSTANIVAYINYAYSVGLRVIVDVDILIIANLSTTLGSIYSDAGSPGATAYSAMGTYIVNQTKNLSGTWGYYLADEPADTTHATVLTYFGTIQTADSTKPVLLISTGDLSTGTTFWGQNSVFYDCCTVGGDSHYLVGTTGRADDPASVAAGTQAYTLSKSIRSATVLQANNATTGAWPALDDQVYMVEQSYTHMQAQLIGWYAYHAIWGSPTVFDGFGPISADGAAATQWSNVTRAIRYQSFYARTVLQDGPLRYFRLSDAVYAATYDDLTTNTINPLSTILPSRTTSLLMSDADDAMSFNGTSRYFSMPTSGLPSGGAAFSMEAWVSMASIPGGGVYPVAYALGGAVAHQEVTLVFNGDLQQLIFGYVGDSQIAYGSTVVANTGYHCVGTFDGTTLKFYVNGILQGSATPASSNITYGIAYIGNNDQSLFWNGTIDEVALYDYALTPVQVKTHYNAGTSLSVTMPGISLFTGILTERTSLTSTLAGTGTLSGTLTATTALTQTLSGTGTLIPTASLATALTTTLNGTGTLVPTISVSGNVALSVVETGVGTLTLTAWTLKTTLATPMNGGGTLSPTLTATLALPSTTLSGIGTQSGTFTETTALVQLLAGLGTLSPALAAKLALPSTSLTGTGVLTATLTATTALAQTLTGTGTLLPTISLATSLTVTVSGTGTLVPTLTVGNTVTLSATMVGTGTFVPTPTYKTALTLTIAGIGTLVPTLSANIALSSTTLSGTGTLSGTFTESTALSLSINGTGTLSGAMTARTALSLVCAASGILVATPSASTALSVTLAGLGILTGTIIKRSTRNAMGRVWIIVQGQVQYHAMGRVTIRARSTYNAQGRVSIALSQISTVFVLADNSAQWDVADNTMAVEVGYNTSDFKI